MSLRPRETQGIQRRECNVRLDFTPGFFACGGGAVRGEGKS